MTYEEAEKLKKECDKALRDNKIKPPNRNRWSKKRVRFAKPDESKIRQINSNTTYWNWVEAGMGNEPLEANPDLWEDSQENTVDE